MGRKSFDDPDDGTRSSNVTADVRGPRERGCGDFEPAAPCQRERAAGADPVWRDAQPARPRHLRGMPAGTRSGWRCLARGTSRRTTALRSGLAQ